MNLIYRRNTELKLLLDIFRECKYPDECKDAKINILVILIFMTLAY